MHVGGQSGPSSNAGFSNAFVSFLRALVNTTVEPVTTPRPLRRISVKPTTVSVAAPISADPTLLTHVLGNTSAGNVSFSTVPAAFPLLPQPAPPKSFFGTELAGNVSSVSPAANISLPTQPSKVQPTANISAVPASSSLLPTLLPPAPPSLQPSPPNPPPTPPPTPPSLQPLTIPNLLAMRQEFVQLLQPDVSETFQFR